MTRRPLLLLAAGAVALSAVFSPAFSQQPKADALAPLRRALANRDWASSERLASQAIAAKRGDAVDLLFLRAVARRYAGNKAGALADLRAAQGHAEAGRRSSKAAFRAAALLASMGRSEEALTLTETAVAGLRDSERRASIGRIYLDVVETLVRPTPEEGVVAAAVADPDWKSAYPLLLKAEALELTGAIAAGLQLDLLRCEIETKPRGADPAKRARAFRTANPDHAALGEVRYLLGQALARGNYLAAAREAFLEVVQHHADSVWAPKALDASADALLRNRHANNAGLAAAIADTEQLVSSHADHDLTVPAVHRLAKALAARPALRDRAMALYERIAARWPAHALAGPARLEQAALMTRHGQGEAAIALLQAFVKDRPVDAAWQAAVEQIADVRHAMAEQRYRAGMVTWGTDEAAKAAHAAEQTQWRAQARAIWQTLIDATPTDRRVPYVLFAMAQMELRDGRTAEAIAAWETLATRFPQTTEAGQARYAIGTTYAGTLKEYARALAAYAKVPKGKWGDLAKRQIAALKSESLSLDAKRLFRSGEALAVELKTRNVETLEMAAYRIDLKEHFLQTGHLDSLVKLDVALIKPDHTWTVTVAGATPLAPHTQLVPLAPHVPAAPAGSAAAWVVTARTKSLEARTALLVTDLEALTALSKARTWSHIVDRRTGARVDGSSVQRGVDGALLSPGPTMPEDAPQGTMSVLVERDGHAALADLNARSLRAAPTPAATGWLWTDRTSYQPGEIVRVYGMVRDVGGADGGNDGAPGGEIVIPQSGAYRCTLVDATTGLELAREVVPLDAHGAFALQFSLPDTLMGRRRCDVTLAKAAGSADVKLQTVRLAVDTTPPPAVIVSLDHPSQPIVGGTAVQARFRITDGQGEPITHEIAEVTVGDAESVEVTTGAMGYAGVALSAEASAEGSVRVGVHIRGTSSLVSIPVRSRDLIVRRAASPAAGLAGVAGEPYVLALEARRGEEAAAGVELRASVRQSDEILGWKPVGDITTLRSGADGNVAWTFTPTAGGAHRLRLEYTDRHGLPVRQEWPLDVAGAGDPARARLIASRLEQSAGATVPLRLISDLGATSAWVIVHGDRLWSAKRINLTGPATALEVTLPPAPHRNARVTCLVEHDGTVYEPSMAFAINHSLKVSCEVPEAPQRPGATTRVRVRLTDPSGAAATGRVTVVVMAAPDGAPAHRRIGNLTNRFVASGGQEYLRFGLSAAYRPPSAVEARDSAIERALEELTAAAGRAHAPVMVEQVPIEDIVQQRALPGQSQGRFWNDALGTGGGAGGAFGGRFGGKRDLVARGGGGRGTQRAVRVPQPPVYAQVLEAGADGAVADVVLPLTRGRYTVLAVAASGATLFGSAKAELTVGGDVDVEVTAPSALRTSDRSAARVRLQNRSAVARSMVVSATSLPAAPATAPQTVQVAAGASVEVAVAMPTATVGSNQITITVDPGDGGAPIVTTWRYAVRLDDPAEATGSAGVASGTVETTYPAGGVGPLRVHVDGSAAAVLMTIAEQPAGVSTDRASLAAELWTAAEALNELPATNDAAWNDALRARAAGVRRIATQRLYRLLALRTKGTGSSWRNSAEVANDSADPEAIALSVVALARADAAGLPVPEGRLSAAVTALDGHFTDATDDNAKAWLLFCRSFHAQPSYAWVNRLFRSRAALGTRGLALLAHTLATGGRTADAKTVLAELEAKTAGDAGARHWAAAAPKGRFGEDPATITAVVLDAARIAGHAGGAVAEAEVWFRAQRQGAGWSAPAAAVVALRGRSAAGAVPAQVRVSMDAAAAGAIVVGSRYASQRVQLDAARVLPAGGAISLAAGGGGQYWWSVSRSAAPSAADAVPARLAVTRVRTRTAGRVEGRWTAAGRTIEGGWNLDPEGIAGVLTPGWESQTAVELTWGDATPGAYWLYEPLPHGTIMVPGSLEGVEAVRRAVGGVWVRFERNSLRTTRDSFTYRLRAQWPGTYVAGAPRLVRAIGTPAWVVPVTRDAATAVAAAGSDPGASSEISSDERYTAGLAANGRKDYPLARTFLLPLADRRLRSRQSKSVRRALLEACVGAKAGEDVVRFFEVLRERDPSFVIAFDQMIDVGTAYRDIGEHERSRQIYAAVADALFLQEAGAVGALEQQGHTREAFGAAERLLTEYGDSDVVRSTMFAYAQRAFFVGRRAPVTRAEAGTGYTRDDLFAIATGALHRYLADFSTEAAADEVSLTLATAQMEAGEFGAARATAKDAAARHADSKFLDTFDYIQAAAAFAVRDFDAALALCRRLITHNYGVKATAGPSVTAALGHHMTAQIHHARGELEEAVESYRKVRENFADAARALRFLQREGLRVPELTVVRGTDAVRLDVEHRGDDSLVVQVYPVDLRMLLMTHRDTAGLAAVNLAGVKPSVMRTVAAGAGARKGVQPVALNLPGVGAYLVVVRAGTLRARGLVVRSDLAIEVQSAGGEAYRVNVASTKTGAYVARAAVTFIAPANSRIVSRQTDLRGICEAGGLAGEVAIVAEHQGHYAVHYGSAAAQQDDHNETENDDKFEQEKSNEPMSQLEDRMKEIRGKNEKAWFSNTTKQQKGVEAGRAKK